MEEAVQGGPATRPASKSERLLPLLTSPEAEPEVGDLINDAGDSGDELLFGRL